MVTIIIHDPIGSANINQRSLAGSRDTELAVVLHQVQQRLLITALCRIFTPCIQPEHTLLTALAHQRELPQGDIARWSV